MILQNQQKRNEKKQKRSGGDRGAQSNCWNGLLLNKGATEGIGLLAVQP